MKVFLTLHRNPERQSIENTDHASLKLNKNRESHSRPFKEYDYIQAYIYPLRIESNLLLSNIDISNKDLIAQKSKHNDDLQKNGIKESFIRPAPKLSAYRSDDVAVTKHSAVSNGRINSLRQSYKIRKGQEKKIDFL